MFLTTSKLFRFFIDFISSVLFSDQIGTDFGFKWGCSINEPSSCDKYGRSLYYYCSWYCLQYDYQCFLSMVLRCCICQGGIAHPSFCSGPGGILLQSTCGQWVQFLPSCWHSPLSSLARMILIKFLKSFRSWAHLRRRIGRWVPVRCKLLLKDMIHCLFLCSIIMTGCAWTSGLWQSDFSAYVTPGPFCGLGSCACYCKRFNTSACLLESCFETDCKPGTLHHDSTYY